MSGRGRFQRGPLKALDAIYRFVGGFNSPNEVDTTQPIILTHDVSRVAENEQPGFFKTQGVLTHVGASTERTEFTVDAVVTALLNEPPEGLDVWYIGAWANQSTTGALTQVDFGVNLADRPFIANPFDPGTLILQRWNDSIGIEIAVGGEIPLTEVTPGKNFRPFFLPTGTMLEFVSVSTGAVTFNVIVLLWAGPRGTTPPGFA